MNIALTSSAALRNHKEATRITLLSLAGELLKLGHQVVIICQHAPGYPNYECLNGVELYRYQYSLLPKLTGVALALRQIQKKKNIKFEIIHSFSSSPLFILSNIAARLYAPKARIIHTLRSYSRVTGGNSFYFLLNLATKVTVPTKIFSYKLRSVPAKKIVVIPSSIELTKFYPQNKKELKKKYRYQNDTIIFHYGAMWQNKGTHLLLKSIPLLVLDNPKLKFLFAPRYNDIKDLQEITKQKNISQYVEFITGEISIEEYVNLAEVVVLPYLNLKGTEGIPSCLLEAMACKAPVVTTRLPEIAEIADGAVYLADPGDAVSLVQQIKRALKETSAAGSKAMIDKAYQIAAQHSLDKIAQRFLKLYKENC